MPNLKKSLKRKSLTKKKEKSPKSNKKNQKTDINTIISIVKSLKYYKPVYRKNGLPIPPEGSSTSRKNKEWRKLRDAIFYSFSKEKQKRITEEDLNYIAENMIPFAP